MSAFLRRGGDKGRVLELDAPVPAPQDVPKRAGLVRDLAIVPANDHHHRSLLNTKLVAEHRRRAALHVGRQIKYLVSSAHGWLGRAGVLAGHAGPAPA